MTHLPAWLAFPPLESVGTTAPRLCPCLAFLEAQQVCGRIRDTQSLGFLRCVWLASLGLCYALLIIYKWWSGADLRTAEPRSAEAPSELWRAAVPTAQSALREVGALDWHHLHVSVHV